RPVERYNWKLVVWDVFVRPADRPGRKIHTHSFQGRVSLFQVCDAHGRVHPCVAAVVICWKYSSREGSGTTLGGFFLSVPAVRSARTVNNDSEYDICCSFHRVKRRSSVFDDTNSSTQHNFPCSYCDLGVSLMRTPSYTPGCSTMRAASRTPARTLSASSSAF